MNNIILGTTEDGTPVEIDIKTFLTTRGLIQASSGGGKSRTLRRMAEQFFGKVQTFIIDKEGEFPSLREKFGYALVGNGGETPTDPQTAELVCQKLLESGLSCIFDLYSLKDPDRHSWVKNFLDALMNAPKTLWHPVMIIVDEAHRYCMDSETEILTKQGWRGWKDVLVGDEVVAYNLEDKASRFEKVKRIIHRPYEGEMVSLKSDGIDALVTPDHRVVYNTVQRNMLRYGKKYGPYVRPASDLPRHINIPIGEGPFGNGCKNLSLQDCMLMGLIITDGNFCGGSRKKYISIEQAVTTNKAGIQTTDYIEAAVGPNTRVYDRPARTNTQTDGKIVKHQATKTYYLGVQESSRLLQWFKDDIHRIPREILANGSKQQLEALLEGILIGDGSNPGDLEWGYKGWAYIAPGDYEPLADDMLELCARLGVSASKNRASNNTQWVIKLSKRKSHYIRKTKSTFYSGMTWDITVPSGAFVARRRGKFFVTGNCPERGMGESEAYGPMIDLATDGRKRGYAAVFATQRLGKLSKNASAELLNRFIGRTLEDIDVDRAADLMSVRRSDRQEFDLGLKTMKPGRFWVFGQAVSIERKLIHVGPVETTHPEPGTAAAGAVPPTPEMVKKLLPQLADLPQQVENKLKTEGDLKQEILSLKARLSVAEKKVTEKTITVTVEKPVEKVVEVPVVDTKTIKAVHQVVWSIERAAERFDKLLEMKGEMDNWCGQLSKELNDAIDAQDNIRKAPVVPEGRMARTPVPQTDTQEPAPQNELLSNSQFEILRGLREFNAIDVDYVTRAQLAGWLGKKVTGTFLNDLARLKVLGMIEYHTTPTKERAVLLTNEGLKVAPKLQWEVSPEGVFSQVLSAITRPQQDIMKICRYIFPKWISREELAKKLDKVVSGTFLNDLSKLHTAEMIEYGDGENKGCIRLAAWTVLASSVPA